MPSFIQGCNGKNTNGTVATAAFGSANGTGNLLAVSVLWFARTVSSSNPGITVTDSLGNTYKNAQLFQYLGGGVTLGVYYVPSSTSGANTITVTSTLTGALFCSAHEVAPDASQIWKLGGVNAGSTTATHEIDISSTPNGGYSGNVYSFACMGIDSDNQQPTPFNTSAIWTPRQYNLNTTAIDTGATTTGGAELLFYGSLSTFESANAGSLSFTWLQNGRPVFTAAAMLVNFVSTVAVCDAPTASPLPGTYSGTQNVTLTQDEGKDMYYTTDGSTPTTSSTHYTGTIAISSITTLKVLAHDAGAVLGDSGSSFLYTIVPPAPANSNITISWERRTRVGGAWVDGTGEVPLSEDTESYDMFIYTGDGSTILRSVLGLTTKSFNYTAEMQYNDFGAYQEHIYVKVYQNSAQVGHGFPAINANLGGGTGWSASGSSDANSILGSPITGTAADGDILMYRSATGAWEVVGPVLRRQAVTKVTASLANNASETGSLSVACGLFAIVKIDVDRACRVQLYSTAAFRTADASRAYGTNPASGSQNGIIADFGLTTGGAETWVCSPPLIGANADSSPAQTIYYRITNMSGGTSTVTSTLTLVPMEIL